MGQDTTGNLSVLGLPSLDQHVFPVMSLSVCYSLTIASTNLSNMLIALSQQYNTYV